MFVSRPTLGRLRHTMAAKARRCIQVIVDIQRGNRCGVVHPPAGPALGTTGREGSLGVDMDRMTEQAALLALLRDRRSGWGAVADAVETHGSAYEVLMQGQPGEQGELFSDGPSPNDRLGAARSAIEQWRGDGLQLVTLLDDDYPGQLLTIHQRPPFLFYRGKLDARDACGVAIVGTRKPSLEGRHKATEI